MSASDLAFVAPTHWIDLVEALSACSFSPGSFDKRFVRQMRDRLQARPPTLAERNQLERLAHSYRRQLGGCKALDCGRCP